LVAFVPNELKDDGTFVQKERGCNGEVDRKETCDGGKCRRDGNVGPRCRRTSLQVRPSR